MFPLSIEGMSEMVLGIMRPQAGMIIGPLASATGRSQEELLNIFHEEGRKIFDALAEISDEVVFHLDPTHFIPILLGFVARNVQKRLGTDVDLKVTSGGLKDLFEETYVASLTPEALIALGEEPVSPTKPEESPASVRPAAVTPAVAPAPKTHQQRLAVIGEELGLPPEVAAGLAEGLAPGPLSDEEYKQREDLVKVLAAAFSPVAEVPFGAFEEYASSYLAAFGYPQAQAAQLISAAKTDLGIGELITVSQADLLLRRVMETAVVVPALPKGTQKSDVISTIQAILTGAGKKREVVDAFVTEKTADLPELVSEEMLDALIRETNSFASTPERRPDTYTVTSLEPWTAWIADTVQREIRKIETSLKHDFSISLEGEIAESATQAAEAVLQRMIDTKEPFTNIHIARSRVWLGIETAIKQAATTSLASEKVTSARQKWGKLSEDFWNSWTNNYLAAIQLVGGNAEMARAEVQKLRTLFDDASRSILDRPDLSLSDQRIAELAFTQGRTAVGNALARLMAEAQTRERLGRVTEAHIEKYDKMIAEIIQLQAWASLEPVVKSRGLDPQVVRARLHDAVAERLMQRVGSTVQGEERNFFWDAINADLFKVLAADRERILR